MISHHYRGFRKSGRRNSGVIINSVFNSMIFNVHKIFTFECAMIYLFSLFLLLGYSLSRC